MAPVIRSCSLMNVNRASAICNCKTSYGVHVTSSATSCYTFAGRCRRRCHGVRLRRVCWSMLRQNDYTKLALLRPVADATKATAKAVAATKAGGGDVLNSAVDDATRRGYTSNNDVERQLMTLLYRALLVDQLALQLHELRLETDTQSTTTSSSCKNSTALLASALTTKSNQCVPASSCQSMLSAPINECSRRTTNHDTKSDETRQPCTDELQQTTSMIGLLRRSCRIPRPVPRLSPSPSPDVTSRRRTPTLVVRQVRRGHAAMSYDVIVT